jgi:hypothetical protein
VTFSFVLLDRKDVKAKMRTQEFASDFYLRLGFGVVGVGKRRLSVEPMLLHHVEEDPVLVDFCARARTGGDGV